MLKEGEIKEARKVDLDSLEEVWPLYHGNEVAIGNLESSLAITTLWTERQKLLNHLDQGNYSVVGQCFSPRGVSLILRELLANPRIRTLAVWGRDATNTGNQLMTFFERGFNEDYTLPGFGPSIRLHEEIPRDELENIRRNVACVDLRGKIGDASYSDAAEAIGTLSSSEKSWRDYGLEYPLADPKADRMPGELVGYQVKGATIEETWLDILDTILRFGRIKEIPGEDSKLDIPDLMAIITGEENHESMVNPNIFRYIPNFPEEVRRYVDQFTSPIHLEGSAYSYGEELFAHNTRGGGVDQIGYIIGKLSGNIHTGRAFASTWNVGRHMKAPEGPCLVGVQFSAIEDEGYYKLLLTSHFKTHDMFSAWPANVFGLRELQRLILERLQEPFHHKDLELRLGPLVTLSGSAHIYGGQIENARETLEEFPPAKNRTYDLKGGLNQDPRGTYRISIISDREIEIQRYNPSAGEIVESEKFRRRSDAERWISDKRFSNPEHGVYLGREIANAFTVIKLRETGIDAEYKQDRRIVFPKRK